MKHNFHIFRNIKPLNMQKDFIFFDTESNIEQIDNETKNLTFKLGTSVIWNRNENRLNYLIFYDTCKFWNNVENHFDNEHKTYIMFAHNTHFDFKMVDGFNELDKRGWKLISHYVRNKTYILYFKKENYSLHIWDTTNYIPHSLESIGKTLGFPKLKIDFDKCSKRDLEIYCMRDTEILYVFVSNLINFLIKYDLSRLRATSSSLSFSIFRHKFYNVKDKTIWIHDFKRAIKLERESYKGGITDVFKLGKTNDIYKTDINSMYPDVMRNLKVPTKLIYHSHESDKKLIGLKDKDVSLNDLSKKQYEQISNKLKKIYNEYKKDYGIIAKCTIYIPKKYAYLLQDYGLGKTSFAYGKFEITLCTPELNFVEKYGKILHIHELNVYEVKNIFKEFVDFFYGLKKKYTKENNDVYTSFTKIILNGQYGKWGQKEYKSERLDDKHKYLIRNQDIILDIIKEKLDLIQNSAMVYLGSVNSKELYVIDKKLYLSYNTGNNSKDSFVAISSFITSKARMNLIKFVLIAKRKNICYTDTDSLFVNQVGYQNLLNANCIDKYALGKLKKEGFGKGVFFNPKFYDFKDINDNDFKRKCKGINQQKAKLIKENDKCVIYKVEQWDKFKSDMKKGNFTNQLINVVEKVMSKKYDKGKITKNNFIEPFHIREIT